MRIWERMKMIIMRMVFSVVSSNHSLSTFNVNKSCFYLSVRSRDLRSFDVAKRKKKRRKNFQSIRFV